MHASDFKLNVTINNSEDRNAHKVNASMDLPSGFVIVSGANPRMPGIIEAVVYRNASWVIRAPHILS